ncbi:MAG: peptidoglycan DD-metalloendopeptidase family protein [Deltaproteobacteria bacterium]|nr:peptidoglycan DD-metalloendopeptidase family protein [Deltaproteobacteria bacterium]
MFSFFYTFQKNMSIFKQINRKIFFSALILFCSVLTVTNGLAKADVLSEIGVVTVKNLNLRPAPDRKNTPIKRLKLGTRVEIIEHEKKWLKVLHEGLTGYVRNSKNYIQIIQMHGIERNKKDNLSTLDLAKNEVENINRRIEQRRANIRSYTKKEADIVARLDVLDRSLNDSRRSLRLFKEEVEGFEKRIDTIRMEYDALSAEVESCEEYMSLRLVALYKLNALGGMYILASSESISELYQRKRAFEQILSYDNEVRSNLLDSRLRLKRVKDSLNARKNEKLALEKSIDEHVRLISREQVERSKCLDDIRNKKSLELASLASLNKSAKALDNTIRSLILEPKAHKSAAGLQTYGFSSRKGLLRMPVKGRIVNFFGPYQDTKFNMKSFRKGIDIKIERGEPVRAVYNGTTIYAKWFKGYGNMIIIDHGENYYTVYAHAEEIFITKGDIVEEGDVVATVGDTGSMIGSNLHFEIRHHGKPIDPLEWINKDRKG